MDFSTMHPSTFFNTLPKTPVPPTPEVLRELYAEYMEWGTQNEERTAIGVHTQGHVCSFRGNVHDVFVVHHEDM